MNMTNATTARKEVRFPETYTQVDRDLAWWLGCAKWAALWICNRERHDVLAAELYAK